MRAGLAATGWFAVSLVACSGGDSTGVESAQSVQVVVGSVGDRTGTLRWIASVDSSVRGYRVYMGTASRSYGTPKGTGLDAGNALTYQFQNLEAGRTYYFAVTAYDGAGNESDYSNEAAKLIQ